jgi:maltooligosyltrehalose trehalohydrolase
LMPHLDGAKAMAAHAAGAAGVVARWRLANGSVLTIACNLGREPCPIEQPEGRLLFESRAGAGEQALHGRLDGLATAAFLEQPG